MRSTRQVAIALGLLPTLAGCGDRPSGGPSTAAVVPPKWARLSAEQVLEAQRLGVEPAMENTVGMRFLLIPAGTFRMGSPPTELGRDDTESEHGVTITKAYYLQMTEVTNAQFRKFKPDHDSGISAGGGSLNGDDQPVVRVSWDDATQFLSWLKAREPERDYRLPSEAEWEHACRAGTSTPFWWGNWISSDMSNYDGNVTPYDDGRRRDSRGATVAVGLLPASPWGLYEIHGNVREWCADWYDDRDYPLGVAVDPTGPSQPDSRSRLTRGGAFRGESAYLVRAAYRAGIEAGEAREYVGFRIAVSARGRSKEVGYGPNR